MTSIRRWIISSENNIKNTYLKNTDSGLVSTKVRLIDISHDPIATNPGNYAKFTFEFTEVVGIMSFNNIPETPTGHMNE
ncbi:MAG: hypothetical protein MJ233_02645 [Mycoplasmoidaceae bacterium]|nr:hypothetical protein [Mycoplasmoidaceae bacterium]